MGKVELLQDSYIKKVIWKSHKNIILKTLQAKLIKSHVIIPKEYLWSLYGTTWLVKTYYNWIIIRKWKIMLKAKDLKNRIELIILIFGEVTVKEVIQVLNN